MFNRAFASTKCARCTPFRRPVWPRCRALSTGPTPSGKATGATEEDFARHTLFALDVGKRFLKFSLFGLLVIGTTAATAYEGVHLYVENTQLAPETDLEVRKWEWDKAREGWSGDPLKGGTDPALGLKTRHIIRAAWMSQNWGVGYSTAAIGSETHSGDGLPGPGGINVIDARLQRTEDFLRSAIATTEAKGMVGALHPQTMTQLLARHANVLERLGVKFLPEAKSLYERMWAESPAQGVDAAYVALKLGDLNGRLSRPDDALAWWSRALSLVQGQNTVTSDSTPPQLPTSVPTSPLAQRILSTVLVSLSAFYATSGQLRQAQAVEEASLKLLRTIRSPESLAAASPPQALHALYLLQRSSLLSIHLAEVLHAQRQPVGNSIQWLSSAADSSERVARALTGLPLSGAKAPVLLDTDKPLLPVYTTSHSMNKPASSLLRDARRTAAEAWNLMGVLKEAQEPKNLKAALHCYERALAWAGTAADDPADRQAAEVTLESDWNVFLGNYLRAKRRVAPETTG